MSDSSRRGRIHTLVITMASPAEPMSVDEPETRIDSDQAKSTAEDPVVHAEPSGFAPPSPVPVGGTASAPGAVAVVDKAAAEVESLAATANVEGVRRGGKAAAVFDGETLNADVPSDSGMRHVRVSINVSLSLVAHTHVMLCVSQEKSQESSQILP